MENIQALRNLLQAPGKVCVVTHTHPDGDAAGSLVAICIYIREFKKI